MKIGWLSDIHLNFLEDDKVSGFVSELSAADVDAWMISGDIGESQNFKKYLDYLLKRLDLPLYVVLGNHDYYHGTIADISVQTSTLSPDSNLIMLSFSDPITLSDDVAIVGDDGWGDARFGNPMGSQIELNDFSYISELRGLKKGERIHKLNLLGDSCADRMAPKLEAAASRCRNIIVVTHVPPFEGATWHNGHISVPDWMPWFSCSAVGDKIMECSESHPEVTFRVFCGHTHGRGYYRASKNISVFPAGATYGEPEVQGVLTIDSDKVEWHSNYRFQPSDLPSHGPCGGRTRASEARG